MKLGDKGKSNQSSMDGQISGEESGVPLRRQTGRRRRTPPCLYGVKWVVVALRACLLIAPIYLLIVIITVMTTITCHIPAVIMETF